MNYLPHNVSAFSIVLLYELRGLKAIKSIEDVPTAFPTDI